MEACVYVDGQVLNYSYCDAAGNVRSGGFRGDNWFVRDDTCIKWGQLAYITFNVGDLLKTRNGSVVQVAVDNYPYTYKGPKISQFYIIQVGNDITSDNIGNRIYYDSQLFHRPGNHYEYDSGWDIIGIFNGKLKSRCPHCGEYVDASELT